MEGKKGILTVILVVFLAFIPWAGNNGIIYESYVSGKMDSWKKEMDRMHNTGNREPAFLLELVNYQYGYIGYCMGANKKSEARIYLELAEKNLTLLEQAGIALHMVNAYKAAFFGFRIGLNPVKAPLIGPKSDKAAGESLRLDPHNWLGLVQKANIQYYMPSAFGGSKKEALSFLLKAKAQMEKDPRLTEKNWNYLSMMAFLMQVYEGTGDLASARKTGEVILKKEPRFVWVRDELYPGILKKINQK